MDEIYFTLNAHKKCIGQYNFDPLLYYINTSAMHSLFLDTPGTYTIQYVSGAICSFNIDTIINELSANNKYIDKNQTYWNRYYESSALIALGQYDITYFPTSTILIGCFQCQFGTLPGFTSLGYKTKALAQTFNSQYLSNPKSKYNYTDQLVFTLSQPQNLVFWYTDIAEQSVQGAITYKISFKKNIVETVYLNDISVIAVNKFNILQYSMENYYLNLYKKNLSDIQTSNTQQAWIEDIENRNTIKNICDFNTIGYDEAYLNDIKYTDTLNYNCEYSSLYYWQLIKKVEAPYGFIGKFDNKSDDLLLYPGSYTIFLVNDIQNTGYRFKKGYNINEKTGMDFLPIELLNNKITCSFNIRTVGMLNFKFLKDNVAIYLYNGVVTLPQLNDYIKKTQNNKEFITQYNTRISNDLQVKLSKSIDNPILNIQKIIDYNEYLYNYYIDLSQYLYYNIDKPSFYIYASQKIGNNLSIGPYTDVSVASTSIFNLFTELKPVSSNYICVSAVSDKYILQYNIIPIS